MYQISCFKLSQRVSAEERNFQGLVLSGVPAGYLGHFYVSFADSKDQSLDCSGNDH